MSKNPGATTSPVASMRRRGAGAVVRTQRGDAFTGDAHVGSEPCRAGAVDDVPASDEEVAGGGLLGGEGERRGSGHNHRERVDRAAKRVARHAQMVMGSRGAGEGGAWHDRVNFDEVTAYWPPTPTVRGARLVAHSPRISRLFASYTRTASKSARSCQARGGYWSLSATIGSTRVARSAGSRLAHRPGDQQRQRRPARTTGRSNGPTP